MKRHCFLAATILLGLAGGATAQSRPAASPAVAPTATPIKYVVVIFQENVSFDHYFGTYPFLEDPQTHKFTLFNDNTKTPVPNNLLSAGLLGKNPNSANPFLLTPAQNATCDQNHDYTPEQSAFNGGLMNLFVENTGVGAPGCPDYGHGAALTMGYYDGATLTALWNYAQNYAMSDNSYGTGFGPSTPGALSLISGQTSFATVTHDAGGPFAAHTEVVGFDTFGSPNNKTPMTVIGDPQGTFDECHSNGRNHVNLAGQNVGDLLNAKGLGWGWFQGGFTPSGFDAKGNAQCKSSHTGLTGVLRSDYIPHHEPFQYYSTTSNPHHSSPASTDSICFTDPANHQYDLTSLAQLEQAGRLCAVTYIKAAGFQDGHAGYSSPLDEQPFIVNTINRLMQMKEWDHMAIFIAWDDSDGWYDHAVGPVVYQSNATDAQTGQSVDNLDARGTCGTTPAGGQPGRCGYGPRLPLLLISPWARQNFIDSSVTDQSSLLRFIEDNWGLGRLGNGSLDEKAGSLLNLFDFNHRAPRVFLDPATGQVVDIDRDDH